jgi:hypothetical protein
MLASKYFRLDTLQWIIFRFDAPLSMFGKG